jgi:hypothetical protein
MTEIILEHFAYSVFQKGFTINKKSLQIFDSFFRFLEKNQESKKIVYY